MVSKSLFLEWTAPLGKRVGAYLARGHYLWAEVGSKQPVYSAYLYLAGLSLNAIILFIRAGSHYILAI